MKYPSALYFCKTKGEKYLIFLQNLARKIRRFFSKRGFACDNCGAEIFNYPAQRLCGSCAAALKRNDEYYCQKCGRKGTDFGVCLNCKAHLPAFKRGFSPLVYKGGSSQIVNGLKNGKRQLAYFLGEEMADNFLERCELDKATAEILILPVPMTKEKERRRGYNQAAELALVIEERLSELGWNAKTDLDVLEKRRETAQQKHLTYKERAENASSAYRVKKRAFCKDKTCLLVDDIMTTGATGNACAKALYGVGAKCVYFLVAAASPERK